MTRSDREAFRAQRREDKAQRFQTAIALYADSIVNANRPSDRLTEAELAQKVGVSCRTIARWKKRPPWQEQARGARQQRYQRLDEALWARMQSNPKSRRLFLIRYKLLISGQEWH